MDPGGWTGIVTWIGLLSSTMALRYGENVAMTLVTGQLPPRWTGAAQWVVLAAIALLGLLLVETGWEFFLNSTQYYMVSDQCQVHHRWVAAAVPVTGIVILLHLVHGRALLDAPPADSGLDEVAQ